MGNIKKYCLDVCERKIVTKRPEFTEHSENGKNTYVGNVDKTFWVKCDKCGEDKRFSVESAPKWIMELYKRYVK